MPYKLLTGFFRPQGGSGSEPAGEITAETVVDLTQYNKSGKPCKPLSSNPDDVRMRASGGGLTSGANNASAHAMGFPGYQRPSGGPIGPQRSSRGGRLPGHSKSKSCEIP